MAQTDIRVLVPRVRRAVEGVGVPAALSDEEVRDLIADAIADVILYTGGVFGNELVVTDTEGTPPVPVEYATSDELTFAEQSVIAAQAALTYFFQKFRDAKMSERIGDEAQTWEWAKSAQLFSEQLKLLIKLRDEALEQIEDEGAPLDSYASFLAARDSITSRAIEPWVEGAGVGGLQQDPRFGGF